MILSLATVLTPAGVCVKQIVTGIQLLIWGMGGTPWHPVADTFAVLLS